MGEITRWLTEARHGNREAENALFSAVYGELRVLARAAIRREATVSTLDVAALIGEAWMRMDARDDLAFPNRSAFFAYSSRVMRSVVIDALRERGADKRGGGWHAVTLSTAIEDGAPRGSDLVAVDRALQRLARLDARSHDLFEMHFFAGMEQASIAEATGLSLATVKRDLRKARAWLVDQLDAPAADPALADE